MNTLKSAFWEYPQLADEGYLHDLLERQRLQQNDEMYLWLMRRLLEYGRAVDALRFFSLAEIARHLDKLRLSEDASAKWTRLLRVYGSP